MVLSHLDELVQTVFILLYNSCLLSITNDQVFRTGDVYHAILERSLEA
jgi:hypothetical protein